MYKCQCCDVEISRADERDRGEWCIICFPPTKMFGGCDKCKGENEFGEYISSLVLGIENADGSPVTDEQILSHIRGEEE